MGRKPKDVTDAELSLLQTLWQDGSATIRQLTDRVYPDGTSSDYATVKKLLSRLESKGFVRRNRQQMAHVFEAAISNDDLVGMRLQTLADNLCGGSRTPLLTHLLKHESLTAEERRQLRSLLDELVQNQKNTTGAKRRPRR